MMEFHLKIFLTEKKAFVQFEHPQKTTQGK